MRTIKNVVWIMMKYLLGNETKQNIPIYWIILSDINWIILLCFSTKETLPWIQAKLVTYLVMDHDAFPQHV